MRVKSSYYLNVEVVVEHTSLSYPLSLGDPGARSVCPMKVSPAETSKAASENGFKFLPSWQQVTRGSRLLPSPSPENDPELCPNDPL